MCGLFGYHFNGALPPLAHRAILTHTLGTLAESRGAHACGYAGYHAETNAIELVKESDSFKVAASPLDLVTRDFHSAIGHTRFATVGGRTAANAHPFEYKHIIGAHNGGIYNHDELKAKYPERKDFEVDSQHLIAHIADELPMNELVGYGAVTWFDTRDPGAVYLCRMLRGDLYCERGKDDDMIVWGSTAHIVTTALRSVKWWIKTTQTHLDEGYVYRIFEGKLTKTDKVFTLTGSMRRKTWQEEQAEQEAYEAEEAASWYGKPQGTGKVTRIGKHAKKTAPAPKGVAGQGDKSTPTSATTNTKDVFTGSPEYRRAVTTYDRKLAEYLAKQEGNEPPRSSTELVDESGVSEFTEQDVKTMALCLKHMNFINGGEYRDMCAGLLRMSRRRRRKMWNKLMVICEHHLACSCRQCTDYKKLVDKTLLGHRLASQPAS